MSKVETRYLIKLNDGDIEFINTGSIFPFLTECVNPIVVIPVKKAHFLKAIEFVEWYNNLSAADKKLANDNDVIVGVNLRGQAQRAINAWVNKFLTQFTNPIDSAEFAALAEILKNDCLFTIACKQFVNDFQTMDIADFCNKYEFNQDFNPEELAQLELDQSIFNNVSQS